MQNGGLPLASGRNNREIKRDATGPDLVFARTEGVPGGGCQVSLQSANDPNTVRSSEPRRLGGILVRKECWKLSLTGRIIFLVIVVIMLLVLQRGIYPFLAVDSPTSTGFLIVDAWLPTYGLKQAAADFKRGTYEKLITGGCVGEEAEDRQFQSNYVSDAAAMLGQLGTPVELVQPVPCSAPPRDRTYTSALAIKKWCHENGITVRSIDVVTKAAHARRSRLLYQQAFGSEVKVGVIAVQDRNYDPVHWWQSTVGVREVAWEGIAYIYTKFFFYPE
jgi:uncharacterized SAM-binding protein YcdF (DUF218 family)